MAIQIPLMCRGRMMSSPLRRNEGILAVLALVLASVTGTVQALPQNCQDILALNPGATDGEYWIFPNNQPFRVFCNDMATTPEEYLTLTNTGGSFNFSSYQAGGASPGTTVITHYTKVRIDPSNLLVNIADQTFSTSTGSLVHSGSGPTVTSMPYGVAMSCNGSPSGLANIDLTGTLFFEVTDPFNIGGSGSSGSANFSSNNQVVNLTGGGFCGWISPDPFTFNPFNQTGTFQLNLAYLLPTALIDIHPGSAPNPINVRSKGVIPVALLGSGQLDVTQVDLSRVHFGPNGTEAMPVHTAIEDVNQDGKPDLVLQFRTEQTGFQCGQYAGILEFYTFSNQLYIGADSIITVGC